MPILRCPICRADNTQPSQCRRCRADLGLLFRLEEQREHALSSAWRCAARGLPVAAVAWARRADELRSDEESRQTWAASLLLAGDYASAMQAARRMGK